MRYLKSLTILFFILLAISCSKNTEDKEGLPDYQGAWRITQIPGENFKTEFSYDNSTENPKLLAEIHYQKVNGNWEYELKKEMTYTDDEKIIITGYMYENGD